MGVKDMIHCPVMSYRKLAVVLRNGVCVSQLPFDSLISFIQRSL